MGSHLYIYILFKRFVESNGLTPNSRRVYAVATINHVMYQFGDQIDEYDVFKTEIFPITYPLGDCFQRDVMQPILRAMSRLDSPHLANIIYFCEN